ncbi:MAG: ParB/RepB/Spo0J family partition protein [Actinobacteria bacterium]|nr:ParB/RepB/Spo0J family partition protein [Actinomycetota bacterium]
MELKHVNLSQLKPAVKLRSGEDKSLTELAASIKAKGVICPLIASKESGNEYSVLDGRRRLEALKLNGVEAEEKIPVLLVEEKKGADIERALITNAVRSELDAWDLAECVNMLSNSYGRSSWELASALGKTERYIFYLLSLFSLPKPILSALRARRITPAHGRCLLKLSDRPGLRDQAFEQLLERDLSVRDLDVLIGSMIDRAGGESEAAPIFKPIVYDTNAGSRVRLEPRRCSIRIEINLKTVEDLEAVVVELKDRIKTLTIERNAVAERAELSRSPRDASLRAPNPLRRSFTN